MRGPTPLDGGSLHVPATHTPILLALLREAVRQGSPLPEARELFEACGVAARETLAARLRASAVATPAQQPKRDQDDGAVLSIPQTGPPSSGEIDVSAVTVALGISAQRVRQLAKSGRLAGRQVSGCWWFTRGAVEDLKRTREAA